MAILGKDYSENRQKVPEAWRLTSHEAPQAAKYRHVTDVAVGNMFNQFSRIPAPQAEAPQYPAAKFGASVVEQATQPDAEPYAIDAGLDIEAIRRQIAQETLENA